MVEIIAIVTNHLTTLVHSYGLVAVFFLMLFESALIPIPSEITMPFAGFMAARGFMQFWPAVAMGTLGNVAGSLLAYFLGATKGGEWVEKTVTKKGRFILIHGKEHKRAKQWFHDKGEWVAFAGRLMPVIRTFISLPAGIAGMNIIKFTIYTAIGSFLWTAALTYAGYLLGEKWALLELYFRSFHFVLAGVAIAVLLAYLYRSNKAVKK